jgi:hypothetical protein
MNPQSAQATNPMQLLRASEGLITHQALYTAAKRLSENNCSN